MDDASTFQISTPTHRPYIWIAGAVMTLSVGGSLTWGLLQERDETLKVALSLARGAHQKDIDYRRWNAGHGGVYVPVTADTQPNPYMAHIAERDVETTTGMKLTLVNPAYMTRQVHEMGGHENGLRGHITSLDPVSPYNAPDAWELEALRQFVEGASEASELADLNGEPHMRYMTPFVTEARCLKCHGDQGYRVGEVRGGLSVSTPMKPLLAREREQVAPLVFGHAAIWILGMGGLSLVSRNLRRQYHQRAEMESAILTSQARLVQLVEEMPIMMAALDDQGMIATWNHEAESVTGFSRDEMVDNPNAIELLHPDEAYRNRMFRELKDRGNCYRDFEWETTCKDGSVRTIAWSNISGRVSISGWSSWGFGIDVTERKRIEAALRRRLDFEALITEIATEFINLPVEEIDSGINRALAAIGEFSDVDRSYVFVFSEDGQRHSNTHEWCREEIASFISDLQELPVDSFTWMRDNVLRAGEVAYVPRTSDLPEGPNTGREEFEREGIKSIILVPMRCRDCPVGFVGLDTVRFEKDWSDDDIALLRIVAGVFANALERKRSEVELREQRNILRGVIDGIDDAIFVKNKEGQYVLLNETAVVNVNKRLDPQARFTDYDFFPQDVAKALQGRDKEVMATQKKTVYELDHTDSKGKSKTYLISKSPHVDHDGHTVGVIGVARDITGRKRMEETLRFLAELSAPTSGRQFFEAIVRFLAESLGVRYAIVGEVVGESDVRVRSLASYANGQFTDPIEYELAGTPCENVVGKTACCHASGIQSLFPDDDLLVQMKVESYLGAPVFSAAGRSLGNVVVMHDQEMPEFEEYLPVIRVVAERLGAEFERIRAEEGRRDYVRLLESLDRIDDAIRGITDISKMLEVVLDVMLDIFGTDRAWLVYPCDPDAPAWSVQMERTRAEYPGAHELDRDQPQSDRCSAVMRAALASKEPTVLSCGANFFGDTAWEEQYSIRSLIAMPIFPKTGKPWMIGMHQCSHERPWTSGEQEHFKEIARRVSDGLSSMLSLRDLQQRESELRDAQRVARVGSWVHDISTGDITCSDEMFRIMGIEPQPVTADLVLSLVHPDDRELVVGARQATEQGAMEANQEFRIVHRDGSIRHCHHRWISVHDESGRELKRFGTSQDITERKEAEEELRLHRDHLEDLVEQRTQQLEESRERLRQAERLASIGTLAAGLAHEINNPVGGILLAAENAEEARQRAGDDRIVSDCLADIVENAQRCGNIIRSVLRFARQEVSEKEICDLNALARSAVSHTEDYVADAGGNVSLALEPDLPPIWANALEIEQVFANLIRNAAEATVGRLSVHIQTESGDGVVRVIVTDTGRGISDDRLKRLFDPFFTTRLEKGGTGLGLSIVHGIIEEHGAAIDVKSEVGKGTTFTIEFPLPAAASDEVGDVEVADR